MHYSTLEPYSYTSPLNDNSSVGEWKGQRSSKFPPTIRHLPAKDLIRTSSTHIMQISNYQTRLQRGEEAISMSQQASKSLSDLPFIKYLRSSTGIYEKAPSEPWILSQFSILQEQNKGITSNFITHKAHAPKA